MQLYIHIPFCKNKCSYCDFNSGIYGAETQQRYIDRLCMDIEFALSPQQWKEVDTIYIGGGTPSVLSTSNLVQIFSQLGMHLNLSLLKEFTVEGNPESITDEFAQLIAKYHVNRVSLGVQSTNEKELKFLGRIHNNQHLHNAIQSIRKSGIKNLSLDLIFALPDQNIESLSLTLNHLLSYEPTHLSCYSLIIEEGTLLMKEFRAGTFVEIEDAEYIKQYRFIVNYLKHHGYHQYEISNFAKEGFESLHNSGYWRRNDYLGIGLGAHSKIGNVRFSNISQMDDYLSKKHDSIENSKIAGLPSNIEFQFSRAVDPLSIELLNPKDCINETIFLGLRLNIGISKNEIFKSIHCLLNPLPLIETFQKELTLLIEEKLLVESEGQIKLTQKGKEISNTVFSRLML